MARCAFSGREIDTSAGNYLNTPDGKMVLVQFYEGYIIKMKKDMVADHAAKVEYQRRVEARKKEMADLRKKQAEAAAAKKKEAAKKAAPPVAPVQDK